MRHLLLSIMLLALATAIVSAQPDETPDALSADALDRMVRVQGDTLNFDDVIVRAGDESTRLESYDLRWVSGNRVVGSQSFPVVKERYERNMTVQKESLPWSSGYWPFISCRLALGRTGREWLSPLEKYDSYVLTQTGKNPRAAAWEANPANKHNYFQKAFEKPVSAEEEKKPRQKGIKVAGPDGRETEIPGAARYGWFGHCNGWAAAACLVPLPPAVTQVKLRGPLKAARLRYESYAAAYDMNGEGDDQYTVEQQRSGTLEFSRPDMKGLLSESFMDCIADMSHPIIRSRYLEGRGVRERGYVYNGITLGNFSGDDQVRAMEALRANGGEPFRDIYPHNFHRICLDYLGQRNQAFVTEIDADNAKDNHPTYGYKYVQRYDADRREYRFEALVTYATYGPYDLDGPNPKVVKYAFRMKLDDRNRIVASDWTGGSEFDHPDFVWVPQSNAPPGQYENKNLDYAVLQQLMAQSGVTADERPTTEGVEGSTGSGGSLPEGSVREPSQVTNTRPEANPSRSVGTFGAPAAGDDERIRSEADER
ncbi:MAG: hypothetical protein HY816_14735 [Candidatus Wallbacteria bacterium]|nr:hypothetical protein [Candidatus Wallbacteria bacterium]